MTEPIDLLIERLEEIRHVRDSAVKNKVCQDDLDKLNNIYNKYYVCVEVLKRTSDTSYIDKGVLYKSSIDIFRDQDMEVKQLKSNIQKLYWKRFTEKQKTNEIKP